MTAADGPPYDGGPLAVAWSGGKDSTLALHRMRARGLEVSHLFSVYDRATGRLPYHGVRRELLEAQARSLGAALVARPAGEGEFEAAFGEALDRLEEEGVEGVVFGNIHLEDVRAWYEERTTDRGFRHLEPLWGGDPARLAREFATLGYRAKVVSVMLESGDPGWLGRPVDVEFLEEVVARGQVDPCGERGEFHSFAWDGPIFREALRVDPGEVREEEGHRFLDLTLASAPG